MNVVAQKFEPDPRYVDYWIDLSIDPTGNVIKSFTDGEWMPLNWKANEDQWRHIQEIVDAVGLERTDDDQIKLPEDDNAYFTGDSIVDQLAKGDQYLGEVSDKLDETADDLKAFKDSKGKPNGIAGLDEHGTVPREQLPSYVDDVIDVYAHFHVDELGRLQNIKLYEDPEHTKPIETGEPDKIYVNATGADDPWLDEEQVGDSKYKNIPYQFRWSGSQFVHIDSNVLILGEITGTAFDGGEGKKLKDAVDSIDILVKEITETPTTGESDIKIPFKQGTKNTKTHQFEYEEKNVTINAATKEKAGVMSNTDKAHLDTAATIPNKLVSELSLKSQTDPDNITLNVTTYSKHEDTGNYTEDTPQSITVVNANNEHAGVMSSEDHKQLWNTLPAKITSEAEERDKKDKVLEQQQKDFETKATAYKTTTDATLQEIKENIKNIADKTGLANSTEGEDGDYTLPESEKTDHFINEAETVFGAIEKLDKVIYEDCVRWTKETGQPERKVIVLPQHSSLKGTVPNGEEGQEPSEKTLHIASINSLNTNSENPPTTVQQVEIGNTDLHLDLKSKDRPTVEVMESTTAYTNEVSKIIYNMVKTGIMTMDQIMPIAETLKTNTAKVHKHVAYSQDELWYGVKFDMGKNGGYYDGTRTGNLTFHKELPIQSKMRGCVINDKDDTIKYLKDDDWKTYADGTTPVADPEGSHWNFFVEIPEHYRLFLQTPDNNIEIRISEYNLPGYTHVEKKYIGAYEATTDYNYADNEQEDAKTGVTSQGYTALWSRPDWQKPVVNLSRENMQKAARKSPDITGDASSHDRSNHWNMYTYDAHTDMTWLFVVEYATLYSQKDFNKALTPEGYHQGGLGKGVTTGLAISSTYSWVPAGVTHVLGSSTGVVEYEDGVSHAPGMEGEDASQNNGNTSTTNKKTEVPRYRGIENPFGHVWKNTVDVIVSGEGNQPHDVYICRDWTKFNDTVNGTINKPEAAAMVAAADNNNPPDGYNLQIFKECPKKGYLKELVGTNWGDLFCKECNGGATKYYTDYHWTYIENGTTTARTLLIGGRSVSGSAAGLFYLDSAYSVADSAADVGTRLTFYGEPKNTTAEAASAIAYAMQPQYEEGPDTEGQVDTHTPLITIPHDGYVMNDDNPI